MKSKSQKQIRVSYEKKQKTRKKWNMIRSFNHRIEAYVNRRMKEIKRKIEYVMYLNKLAELARDKTDAYLENINQ